MGGAVAVIIMKERRLVDAFVRAGATSPERAIEPERIGLDQYGIGWRRLHERAIVREAGAGSGRYYLDVDVWEAQRRRMRRMAFVLLIILVLVALGVFAPPLKL